MTIPRYTDSYRWPQGYANAAQTSEAGYLKAKFDAIRAEQERARAERGQTVTQIKRRAPCSQK